MKTISAKDAREITAKHLSGMTISKWVSVLTDEIRAKAKYGTNSLNPWKFFDGQFSRSPNSMEKLAIKQHFTALGFVFEDHPEPQPGHPCCSAYTTMSW